MYTHVFVGGTFDRLHVGHQSLLTTAFALGNQVTIGLTSDAFVRQYKSHHVDAIRSFATRHQELTDWCIKKDLLSRVHIIAIDDPYQPAASGLFDAIIVTPENAFRAGEINAMRGKQGLTPLAPIEVPLVMAQDGKPISSSRVRGHEIDRHGDLILPNSLRWALAQPLGAIVADLDISRLQKIPCLVTVGDVTSKRILDAGISPSLMVVDNQVERKPSTLFTNHTFDPHTYVAHVKSGPGFISDVALTILREWGDEPQKKIVLIVEGEEDLLALPAVLYAPIGAVVLYGQPGKGLVHVEVTSELKTKVKRLLEQFS
jgi:cytidyltransferase-like protein